MSKKILDTNFILRYLLKDVPDMFEIVCNNIMHGDCSVYPEIIAEAVYVLKSVYRERRIPFELSADPFYSESNIHYLERKMENYKAGRLNVAEHELIEER